MMGMKYNYDFDDNDVLLDIVKRDKSSFLEGACSEHIFYDDIMKPMILNNLDNAYYSTGWWSVKLKQKQEYILFKVSTKKPNSNDIKIGKVFCDKYKVYFLFLDESKQIWIENINDDIIITLDKFMKLNNMEYKYDYYANKDSINITRQDKAIDFLTKNSIIKEYAFQRFFVNYILGVNVVDLVNIDGIVSYKKNNEFLLKIVEIKFKYPSSKGTFGLNKGFYKLFNMMFDYNIPVIHYILYNGTKSENISVIDALTNSDIKSKCFWIYSEIDRNLLNDKFELAPSKTRFDGKYKPQKYTNISKSKFKKIKELKYNYSL